MWDLHPAEGANKSRSRDSQTKRASKSDEHAEHVIFAAFVQHIRKKIWDRTLHHHHDPARPILFIYSEDYACKESINLYVLSSHACLLHVDYSESSRCYEKPGILRSWRSPPRSCDQRSVS